MVIEHDVQDQTAGDAGDRRLPRGIDVGEDECVGGGERVGELRADRCRAGVAVGLEDDDDPAPWSLSRRRDRGRDLCREMRVVVDVGHAVTLAAVLEPAGDAAECRERPDRGLEVHADLARDRDGAGGVGRCLHAGRNRDRHR